MVQRQRRSSFQRTLSVVQAAVLFAPALLLQGTNTAQGAGYGNIDGTTYEYDQISKGTQTQIHLSDGRTIGVNTGSNLPVDSKFITHDHNAKRIFTAGAHNGFTTNMQIKLMNNGDLLIRTNNNPLTLRDTNVVDFAYLDGRGEHTSMQLQTMSWFSLKADGSVYAFGGGTNGQLGTGTKSDKTAPTEVINPDTDTPLTGVRKFIQLNYNNVLLVTDGQVYKIGRAFNSDSFHDAKPINITRMFPAFTSADDFEMGYLHKDVGRHALWQDYSANQTIQPLLDMRYFKINGSYYTLTDSAQPAPYMTKLGRYGYDELRSTQLYPLPVSNAENVTRALTDFKAIGNASLSTRLDNTFFELQSNGDLVSWGIPIGNMGYSSGNYNASKTLIASSVVKYLVAPHTSSSVVIILQDNGRVYALGSNGNDPANLGTGNIGSLTGIRGKLTVPTPIEGTDNEVKDIVDIAASYNHLYALRDNGEVYVISNTQYGKINNVRYVGLLEVPPTYTGTDARNEVYGIGEDGNLYYFQGSSPVMQSGVTGIYPSGYTPVPAMIDKPIESLSYDKFENSVVTLDYPASATIKEYSMDNGVTWVNYTHPIVVTSVGSVTIHARAGLDTGTNIIYSDPLIMNISNDPIEIPVGYPKLLEQDGVVTVDTGAIDLSRVQVQVEVNGQVSDYVSPIQLMNGNHTVSAIILNAFGAELARVTDNINVSPDTPGVLTAPIGHLGDVDSNDQRSLSFSFNPTQGFLQLQHDHGLWVDEPDIFNHYTGSSSDPDSTERKYTFMIPNVIGSVYKARVTDGVNVSAETTLVVTGVVYDPAFLRDANDKLVIDFSNLPTGNWMKEYSLDHGGNYHEYVGPIDVGAHLPIKIRVLDPSTGYILTDKEYITPALNGANPNPSPGVDPTWGTEVTAADQEAILNVIGGGLSSQFHGLLLDNIEIQTVHDYQMINSVTSALLEDSTGQGDGWTYSLSITDFVSDPVLDTGLNTSDLIVKIPSSSLSVDVKSAKVLAGSPDQVARTGNYILGAQKQALAQAEPFQGMGYYDIPMDFTFRVPSSVEVVSAGAGSAHQAGDRVGLRVGVYRSLFTFSLAKGI
ncbi:hypothetical protein ABDI30_02730 [Paenibacillus cisolokensis]|uniref:hypothetical protein n=1 Tax=Paenibacillus cisolokensis TaxID=1658519 RepID=UPI003D29F901